MREPVRCYHQFKGEFQSQIHLKIQKSEINLQMAAKLAFPLLGGLSQDKNYLHVPRLE